MFFDDNDLVVVAFVVVIVAVVENLEFVDFVALAPGLHDAAIHASFVDLIRQLLRLLLMQI